MARESDHERLMHVIPRAAFALLGAREHGTVSFDSALAIDPTDRGELRIRFSAGVTGRMVRTSATGARQINQAGVGPTAGPALAWASCRRSRSISASS